MATIKSIPEGLRFLSLLIAWLGLVMCASGFIAIAMQNQNSPQPWSVIFSKSVIGIGNSIILISLLLKPERRTLKFLLIGISLALNASYFIFLR